MAGYIHDQALTKAIRRLYALGGNRNTGKAMKGGDASEWRRWSGGFAWRRWF